MRKECSGLLTMVLIEVRETVGGVGCWLRPLRDSLGCHLSHSLSRCLWLFACLRRGRLHRRRLGFDRKKESRGGNRHYGGDGDDCDGKIAAGVDVYMYF